MYISCFNPPVLLLLQRVAPNFSIMNCSSSKNPFSSSSARMSVARAWIAAFDTWDLPTLHGLVTEAQDFYYGYLPASLGMAPKSRSEWCNYSTAVSRIFPDFKVRDVCLCRPFVLHLLICDFWPQIKILDIHDTSEPGPVVAHVSAYFFLFVPSVSRVLLILTRE